VNIHVNNHNKASGNVKQAHMPIPI